MSSPPPPVHPRVCGELRKGKAPRKGETGSSPRVRGTPAGVEPAGRPRRFIPACAGNSLGAVAQFQAATGSSPRVRGTLRPDVRRRHHRRFIPACAGNSRAARSRQPRKTVHPRVCGELGQQWPEFHADDGSSPRVRGTRISSSISIVCGTVHPRVCGELALADAAAEIDAGSSPRVRGTLPRHRRRRRARRFIPRVRGTLQSSPARRWRIRFIPACAGNSAHAWSPSVRLAVHPRVCGELRRCANAPTGRSPVHPRVCGELVDPSDTAAYDSGSSPRVRGTPRASSGALAARRFIPACAGNSRSLPSAASTSAVHPRVCGELRAVGAVLARLAGSSPRVRGTPVVDPDGPHVVSVHPRVCGELAVAPIPARSGNGSSPRVRGTPTGELGGGSARRFIPACAGNSATQSPSLSGRAVHPRVCGELEFSVSTNVSVPGSSPRVRGTHARHCRW